ncbi:helix-turn-helix transcriptional regulator [Photobacterium damselae]|uniref:helix-turn-helix transcriptional regulator n=1 Tax=Photobacterium damselae TaxID=38293 RepID=UPI00406976F2
MNFKHSLIKNRVTLDNFHIKKNSVLILKHGVGKLTVDDVILSCHGQILIVLPKYAKISCHIKQHSIHDIEFYIMEIADEQIPVVLEQTIHLYSKPVQDITYSPNCYIDVIPTLVVNNLSILVQTMKHLPTESFHLLLQQIYPYMLMDILSQGINIPNIFHYKKKEDTHKTVTKLIIKDPTRPWKIEDVAKALYTTTSTLRRHLDKEGYKFSKLLIDIRMGLVLNYLTFTDYSINEISDLAGFSSPAYFCDSFKRRYGITPTKFRQNSKYKNDAERLKTVIEEVEQ